MPLAIALVALGLAVLSGFAVGFTFMRAAQHVFHLQEILKAHHSVLKIQVEQIHRLEQEAACRDTSADKPTLQ